MWDFKGYSCVVSESMAEKLNKQYKINGAKVYLDMGIRDIRDLEAPDIILKGGIEKVYYSTKNLVELLAGENGKKIKN